MDDMLSYIFDPAKRFEKVLVDEKIKDVQMMRPMKNQIINLECLTREMEALEAFITTLLKYDQSAWPLFIARGAKALGYTEEQLTTMANSRVAAGQGN